MTARIVYVRLWRGRRGMEALQTVLILGVACVIVVGVRQAYTKVAPQVASKTEEIVTDGKSSGESGNGGKDGQNTVGKNGSDPALTVERGQITFDSEGQEGGPYHSRTPHVPNNNSGLTVGRGYDMKEKSAEKIKADLMAAGLSEADAALYAKAAGLKGADAKKFIKDNKLPELTLAQQKELFKTSYAEKEAEVKRISEKQDVVAKYGATDWAKLSPAIKTLVTDLIFRGDYTGATREFIQPLMVANDVAGLAKVMADASKWPGVPAQRFEDRKKFMDAVAAALKRKS